MQAKQPVSIVIPTLNEVDNIPAMMARIDAALKPQAITYEVVLIDDHSSDGTVEIAQTLTDKYPLSLYSKQGQRGKAYSLLEGFNLAKHDLIVMIDADLQYPPEAIVPMYELMQSANADVVVTNRLQKDVSALRKLSTKVFNLIFARLLFGINFDTQSGLKLFKKDILSSFNMRPSPWSFDLEFLVRALENKYTIMSHDIVFAERSHGATKVKLLSVTYELAKASLQLRWRTSAPRIRAGYQNNNRFLKKAMQVMAFTSLLSVASLGFQQTAHAITVAQPLERTQERAVALVQDVTDTLQNVTPTTTPPTNQPTTTTPTTVVPTTNVPRSSGATTATPAATNRASTAASPSTTNGSSANSSTTNPTTGQTVAATGDVDQSGLSAATAQSMKNLYADTYPNYKLSGIANNTLFGAAQIAILAGFACLGAAIIISGMRARRKKASIVITRK